MGLTSLYIIGQETAPNSFPIINRNSSSTNWANFHGFTNIYWERIIFTGGYSLGFTNTGKTHKFTKCVVRDFTSAFVALTFGSGSSTVEFVSTLFEGNTGASGIFDLTISGGSYLTYKITNCTFDNNTAIWSNEGNNSSMHSNWGFKNNIFSNNTTTFPGNNLRTVITYAHTSEACTNYGTRCISDTDLEYSQGTRANPTD